MFRRLASIGLGSGRLLRAEGEGLLRRAQLSVVWAGAAMLGGAVLAVGLAGLLVAGTAWIADRIGWVPAVAIASAAVVIGGLIIIFSARRSLRRAMRRRAIPADIRVNSERAKMQIQGNEPDHPRRDAGQDRGPDDSESGANDWQTRAAEYISRNPGVVIGGALCVVAAVGPWRSVKLLSRGMMLAGLASSLKDQLGSQNSSTQPGPNGTAPPGQHAPAEPEHAVG